uniref:chondroitin sulfate N-acetylgalactosaminyltransferase 2-like isoform X1 n=1 Tax=Styela clava TaxID=7725 RepID=UPI001939B274|nr:chondroitin sulfate N-acetylgalactosaminyltransferase 2-like isoform X1 [Styela clava]
MRICLPVTLCSRRRSYTMKNLVLQLSVGIIVVFSVLLIVSLHFKTNYAATFLERYRIPKELSEVEQNMQNSKLIVNKIQDGEQSTTKIIASLNHQIDNLKSLLQLKLQQLTEVKKGGKLSHIKSDLYPDADKISHYLMSQVDNAYLLKPHQFKNEYDVTPFISFNKYSLYGSDMGLMKMPEKPLNFFQDIKEDLKEVIDAATELLNDGTLDFVEGYYRTQQKVGTQYELVFRSTVNTSAPVHLITMFRPYGPLHSVSSTVKKSTETVYIITPLQGRADAFRKFIENFKTAAISGDGHIHLTVVCYGDEAITEAKTILKQLEVEIGFKSYQVVEKQSETFSRGKALQEGTVALPGKNPLMFFCDVDMFFTTHFLSQCRSQTRPGSRVFYPIVFSLYNPEIVYKGKSIPSLIEQQVIKRDNGFWRDFGFGMTCQYRNDFNDIGGFDLTIKGWGSEDVLLYRKYTRSMKYQVVRTPVNSLFHHWHPKHCDKALSLDQYNACLRTKSLTEGSQSQLGILYLKEQEDN